MTTLALLIVEDHASFRQALRAVFDVEPDMEVVAHVDRADRAAEAAGTETPDVAIVDLDLPGSSGIAALSAIRDASPRTACLVLTALRDEAEFGRAIEAGAAGILHKSVEMDELLQAIRQLGQGATILTPADTHRWLTAHGRTRDRHWQRSLLDRSLTPREKEVLVLLADGGTNITISRQLGITPETVQTHIRNLMGKLDVSSRLEAVTQAIRLGLVHPPS